MICEKYKNKICVGHKWCGICSLYDYESDPDYHHIMTDKEIFAMKCQQDMFKHYNEMIKDDKYDKAASYYSCIQIMEKYLHEFNK